MCQFITEDKWIHSPPCETALGTVQDVLGPRRFLGQAPEGTDYSSWSRSSGPEGQETGDIDGL
jgi:hypothetical protein